MTAPTPIPAAFAVPDHELVRCVGRGSYGEVWLPRNVMGTYRAAKIIQRKSFDHDRPFEREFLGIQRYEPVSRTHPGLVAVLHIGRNVAGGYFYYVMEIADDLAAGSSILPEKYVPKTLRELARNGPLPIADCLRWSLVLTQALGHLHKNGLLHRDIKPANIIFVNGTPKIADIGLVTSLGEQATRLGTAGYLPPEGPADSRADLFSLGKVLYEISLGKSVDQFPELPTELRAHPQASVLLRLNEIILKACAPDARQRFQSAEEMQTALADLSAMENRVTPTNSTRSPIAELPTARAVQVALCYGAEDARDIRLARLLEQRLRQEGREIVLHEPATVSVAWARKIEPQILRADAIVVLLSTSSVKDDMLAYELEMARQAAQINPGRPLLLPVRVQCPDPLPRRMALLLGDPPHFHWDSPSDDERLISELLAQTS